MRIFFSSLEKVSPQEGLMGPQVMWMCVHGYAALLPWKGLVLPQMGLMGPRVVWMWVDGWVALMT